MIALMYGVTRRIFPLDLEWGRLAADRRASQARCSRLGELLLPTSGVAGFLPRGAVALAVSAAPVRERLLRRPGAGGDARAQSSARAGVSAQPSQDLEALRTRADLMDEVHDPQ